jgi:transcriptional regulator with XRE-family HTH domain
VSSENHALLVAVGERVRALRQRKGWTQTDMAVYLDINRGHISDIERGKHFKSGGRCLVRTLELRESPRNKYHATLTNNKSKKDSLHAFA